MADSETDERALRHDLRTPLNALRGYSELLIEDMSAIEGQPFVGDLRHVVSCTDQMLGRIDRIGSGGMPAAVRSLLRPEAPHPDPADLVRRVAGDRDGAEAASHPQGRILVVDDEPANRDLFSRRLARDGHRVKVAEDGAQALAMVDSETFDLILLDMMMPGLSGFDVLRGLKASDATRHIPVIVISALDEIDSAVRCIEAGAEDYLPKTFNPIVLKARISASLEKKALRDREAMVMQELNAEKQRSEALLLNVLPQSIATRMRQGEHTIADRFECATILFCDLVGFTPLAARLTPTATVHLLSRIFSAFDRSVARWGVEKIKTIGDSYMVAGGIPQTQPDDAARIAGLAFDMLADVETISREESEPLAARIGIHTGEVVAGVIGTNRFAYDVWGDTVNTAARMETHGLVGRIHVTQETRAALGSAFESEARGLVDIKGKGPMRTFFLTPPMRADGAR